MEYNRFRLKAGVRIILLCFTAALLTYALVVKHYVVVTSVITVLLVLQVILLVHFLEKTTRDVARFFNSIRYADFTQTFRSESDKGSMRELYDSMNSVLVSFRELRKETEEQRFFLHHIVHHLGTGIIACNKNGDIRLINAAARKFIGAGAIENINRVPETGSALSAGLSALKPGESTLIRYSRDNVSIQLLASLFEFVLGEEFVHLYTLQNISRELDEKELDAWQNLIRVLTHEIINSITPITSLAESANDLLEDAFSSPLQNSNGNSDAIEDVKQAVRTIEKRSAGLLSFIERYRNMTKIAKPSFREVQVSELFANVKQLLHLKMSDKNIHLSVEINPRDLRISADTEQIEQVLINLILNAMDALEGTQEPSVSLKATVDEKSRPVLQVADNGSGIVEEAKEKIFIPFFSTKKTGSGIGLSLSRQIMRMHGGTLNVESEPNVKTVFTMRF